MDATDMRDRLGRFIAASTGATAVVVDNLRRLAGGASREIWALDARYEVDGKPTTLALVLRRDPGPTAMQTGRSDEFALLEAAAAAGVAVPRVYWLCDDSDVIGSRFFLMQRVEGETIARRLLRDDEYATARRVMAAQLGAALARIHAIDWQRPALSFLPQPPADESPAAAELERYEMIMRAIAPDPHPAFELAFRWLRQRLPAADGKRALVHGDFRVGNVIFGPEGLRSVLDWELAHVGDPMEDLGWLCVRAWRFGSDEKPVGGIGERADLFAAYEAAGGGRVDPERVRFWEVFGNLKWGIITISQAKTFLDGGVKSVELASLGRRTAETELELMELMAT